VHGGFLQPVTGDAPRFAIDGGLPSESRIRRILVVKEWQMKTLKWIVTLLALFTPFIMVGYVVMKIPNGLEVVSNWGFADWMWLMLLGAMMLGFYYLLAVFFIDEEEIEEDFECLDRDHDGFVTPDDASRWQRLAKVFEKFDVDHDGKLSRVEFEEFEHSLPAR
jgi:hypothetical protein